MKSSKKAMLMWFAGALSTKRVAVIASLFIVSVWIFFYLADKTILDIEPYGQIFFWPYVRLADFFLFLGLGVALLFFVLRALGDAVLKHVSRTFELQADAIKIVSGIISTKESFIPYKNVQNVDIQVSGTEFLWGLADVLIFTSAEGDKANPESAEGFIEGLRYKDAVALKDELLKRTKQ